MQQFSNTNAILVQAQKCHSMEYFIFKNILTNLSQSDSCSKKQFSVVIISYHAIVIEDYNRDMCSLHRIQQWSRTYRKLATRRKDFTPYRSPTLKAPYA